MKAFRPSVNRYWLALVIILFFLFSYQVVSEIHYSTLSFDGAMNMQVPLNLMKDGGYATSYGSGAAFDPRVQSGCPLLLPTIPFFFLFGVSAFTAQLPNAIYLIALSLLVLLYVSKLTNRELGIFSLMIFMLTPYLLSCGLHGYGEVPALFFLVLGLLGFSRLESGNPNSWLLSYGVGLSWGLAYLTKKVMLILFPALVSVLLLDVAFIKKLPKKTYFFVATGWVSAVGCFEIYRLTVLGYAQYLSWWKKMIGAMGRQAGVLHGFKDTPSLYDKISIHIHILSKDFHLPLLVLAIFVILPYVILWSYYAGAILKRNVEKIDLSFFILTGVSLTYFIWWIAITPTSKAWPRRILIGYILQEIVSIVAVGTVFKKLSIRKRGRKAVYMSLIMVLALGIIWQFGTDAMRFRILRQPDARTVAVEQIAETILHLPSDAALYGIRWWQAPVLSFLTGRHFLDLEKVDLKKFNDGKNNYFVVSAEEAAVASAKVESVLDRSRYEVADKAGGFALYRIKHLAASSPFTSKERKGRLLSFVDFSKGDYQQVRGLYRYEHGYRWSRVKSSLLLRYHDEPYLRVRIWIPALKNYNSDNVRFSVRLDGSLIKTYKITRSGDIDYIMHIPNDITLERSAVVSLHINRQWELPKSSADTRKLAFIVKRVGFTMFKGSDWAGK